MPDNEDLKSRVLRGGISLTISQFVVAALSLSSVLVAARILGPSNYGIVTVSFGIFYFLIFILKLGMHVYLVQKPDLEESETSQIQAFYANSGFFICLFLWAIAPAAGWWTKQPEVTDAFRWLIPAVWINMVSSASVSMLERDVRFVEIGFIEAFSQSANYLLSIILVLSGWGYMSLIIGTVVRYVVLGLVAYFLHPVPWSWRWRWKVVEPALRYGATYSVSDILISLKNLRVSLLVSRLVSVEAAGVVGIAIRLVEQLSMLRLILLRMSVSVMAKIRDEPEKVRRVISKGMAYQALLNGAICALFSVVSTWIIPLVFDERWLASASIFPFIATGALAIAIFDLHSSTLFAVGHNREVAVFNFIYVGVLWILSSMLTSQLGIWGYGLSEVLALPIFWMLHRSVAKIYGSPNYWNTLWIFLATVVPLFSGIFLSPPVGAGVFVLSYGLLFYLCRNVRSQILELLAFKRFA